MAAALSPEQRELQLVDTVEFRILAVANVEDKLRDLLGRYLAPVILKADSSHASVRVKVRFPHWSSTTLLASIC